MEEFALAAENAMHPTALINTARERIHELIRVGVKLGIISNAQHYTRQLLTEHLGDLWEQFDPELMIFSYEHQMAKPDPRLFEMAIRRARLPAREVLMVGDSDVNDCAPASRAGMQTLSAESWWTANPLG